MFSKFKTVITNPVFIVTSLMLCASVAEAASFGGNTGTGRVVFKPFYDFMYEAATGYLGRGAAITGGIVGPGIADSFFTSAIIF